MVRTGKYLSAWQGCAFAFIITIGICCVLSGCATSAIGKAKQAGLTTKTGIETYYSIIKDAHKDGLVSDKDFLKADGLYDDYFIYQTQYATIMQAWEAGVEPNGSSAVMEKLIPILNQLADMIAQYHLEDATHGK